MNRRILECGALACSAIMIYGWSNASAPKNNSSNCGDRAESTRPNPRKHHTKLAKQCLQTASLASIYEIPRQLFNIQWGSSESTTLPKKTDAIYDDLLVKAQTLASQDQFADAIKLLEGVPRNSRHYKTIQQLEEDWSRELFRQANADCQQGQMAGAIARLDAIPARSQLRHRAIELRQRWSKHDTLVKQAIAANKVGAWQEAIDAIQALEGTPVYYSLPVQTLLQQAMTNLYEPDTTFLNIATTGLPEVKASIAPPETLPVGN
ncbi:MAG: hypothetical protein IGS48_00245 [Oscillatoriales cyanobacterium C42_A2020_001]|nr:hypothetical protein [Leptolyngbyaceae cyanobacterium C42_A2020_001]